MKTLIAALTMCILLFSNALYSNTNSNDDTNEKLVFSDGLSANGSSASLLQLANLDIYQYGRSKSDFREFANGLQSHNATGNNMFIFDPNKLRWYAYDRNGSLVNSGAASGGKHYCRDVRRRCKTPIGTFKVHRKGSAYCKSSKYPIGRGGAPMPYCMFFHGGYAIHGSPDVPHYNASHGCIRVRPDAARWLHRNFIGIGTTVVVRSY